VTSKTTRAGNRRVAPLARLLVFLLFVFVTHSATVEIVHQHGNLLPVNSTGAPALRDADTDHSTTDSSRSTSECLICQLHQHLFVTLLISTPGIDPPPAEEALAHATRISYFAEASVQQYGRAPPQASLL
jgi:hypothetical protein